MRPSVLPRAVRAPRIPRRRTRPLAGEQAERETQASGARSSTGVGQGPSRLRRAHGFGHDGPRQAGKNAEPSNLLLRGGTGGHKIGGCPTALRGVADPHRPGAPPWSLRTGFETSPAPTTGLNAGLAPRKCTASAAPEVRLCTSVDRRQGAGVCVLRYSLLWSLKRGTQQRARVPAHHLRGLLAGKPSHAGQPNQSFDA